MGMFGHLRDTHAMTIETYVGTHGEYRPKILNRKLPIDERCLICTDSTNLYNSKSLAWHIRRDHEINKLDYVKQYILKNQIPTCKCGCGEPVSIVNYKPYIIREYLAGHNAVGSMNPMSGKTHKESSKKKMKDKAVTRIEKMKQTTGKLVLPLHTPEAIKKRADIQTKLYVDRIEKEGNLTLLNTSRPDGKTGYYTLQCNSCQLVFEKYHNFSIVCPKCNPSPRSKHENELYSYLISVVPQNVIIKRNTREILPTGQEVDFYIPEYNLAIEFNGLYWHSEFNGGKDKSYHLKKTILLEEKKIQLIHIFEDEWINYKDIVLSKIKQRLNLFTGEKVYARKCEVKPIDYKTCSTFLNLYHLQGADSSAIRYGLFHKDMLVAVMTFQRPNASRGMKHAEKGLFELGRFCVKHEYLVTGGASKLLTHFIKDYTPLKIFTFADRRWTKTSQNLYTSLGFTFMSVSHPSYWYFKSSNKRYHRFNFTKKKTVSLGGDPNKTEWENMIELGYDRIWDCGTLKYEMTPNYDSNS